MSVAQQPRPCGRHGERQVGRIDHQVVVAQPMTLGQHLRRQNHLAELLARLQVSEGLGAFVQGKHAIDGRP